MRGNKAYSVKVKSMSTILHCHASNIFSLNFVWDSFFAASLYSVVSFHQNCGKNAVFNKSGILFYQLQLHRVIIVMLKYHVA